MTDKIRDHLANERTFLAWIRTALGLMGLGFVVARMGLFLREMSRQVAPTVARQGWGPPVGHEFFYAGVVFLIIATAIPPWAWWDYRGNRRAIEEGRFEPAKGSILWFTGVVLVGGLAIIGLTIARILEAGGH